jgi:hypothetical protein
MAGDVMSAVDSVAATGIASRIAIANGPVLAAKDPNAPYGVYRFPNNNCL